MMKPKESDWKKFRASLDKWRERYLKSKNAEIRAILEDGNLSETEKFWDMVDFQKKESKKLRDCLDDTSIYEYMWGPSEFTVTGALKHYERVNRLKEITVPVLFTCGTYDEAPPSTTRYYQKNLPGSHVHIFEDASHEHHLEKPQEYVRVVRDFLYDAKRG